MARKVEEKPLLKAQIAKNGWAKVRAVSCLIDSVKEEELVNMVECMPKSALEVVVRELKVQFGDGGGKDAFDDRCEHNDAGAGEIEVIAKMTLGKNTAVAKKLFGQCVTTTSRHIPVEKKRESEQKYGGKCGYPNCNKPYEVFHHQERFALSKNHENIVPLCKLHHQIAHSGLVVNENGLPVNWKITTVPNKNSIKHSVDAKFRKFQK